MNNIVMPDNLKNGVTGRLNTSLMLPYTPGPSAITAESNYFQSFFPLIFTPIGPASVTKNDRVTPNGTQAVIQTFGRNAFAVQVSGTFTASVLIEATLDGVNWETLDTISAKGIKQYTGLYLAIRAGISAYTSGNPLVTVIVQGG
jgi:hypothetical protein